MTDLTNFTSTDDVSDAAIEWVMSHGSLRGYGKPGQVREYAVEGYPSARAIILAARLIQQHRPDLLVDPVDAIVREELAKAYEGIDLPNIAALVRKDAAQEWFLALSKRLYLMGIEKGKGA